MPGVTAGIVRTIFSFFLKTFMLPWPTSLELINSYGGSYSLEACQLKNFSSCLFSKNCQAGRLRNAVPWECTIFFYKVLYRTFTFQTMDLDNQESPGGVR